MLVTDFNYHLPPDLIAQHPVSQRDHSRLLIVNRSTPSVQHRHFYELPNLLRRGDLLVLNDSRVIPARLRARKPASDGRVEVFLAEAQTAEEWLALLRPAKRVSEGTSLTILNHAGYDSPLRATVLRKNQDGTARLRLEGADDLMAAIESLGEVPLPPYITRDAAGPTAEDRASYQTVFAKHQGSVAAPTAGLHFTEALLDQLARAGIETCRVTLHVGLGTFAPVKTPKLTDHQLHRERYVIDPTAAATIEKARAAGRRVIAVGTTVVRVLEHVAATHQGRIVPEAASTRIFIHPPYHFRIVDALITNFHLPQSTLLMLVAALTKPGGTEGRRILLQAYAEAVRHRYRFYSYGDAMLLE